MLKKSSNFNALIEILCSPALSLRRNSGCKYYLLIVYFLLDAEKAKSGDHKIAELWVFE
jgi:hypothetical protein